MAADVPRTADDEDGPHHFDGRPIEK